jgi:hypothetical protein
MSFYQLPPNLPDWLTTYQPNSILMARERLMFRDNRTKLEISTYYDDCAALGFYDFDEFDRPVPYFEAYPIEGDTFRCTQPEELVSVVIAELDRLANIGRPVDAEALRLALQNLYDDYAAYYPSAATNSPAMKAAADLLNQTNAPDEAPFNPLTKTGDL